MHMSENESMNRRAILGAAGVVGVTGLAIAGTQSSAKAQDQPNQGQNQPRRQGRMVHTVQLGNQSLQISYLDGNCYPVSYDVVTGSGFTTDGTVWVCDPLDDTHVDGEVTYDGARIATYHLDKDGAEIATTVAGVAKFKLRLQINERKLEYMRCPYNGDILHPGYSCPHDWVTLVSW
jgi:hypothetical protein